MAKNTLTFELGGQVELRDLENGINLFRRLVHALTPRAGVTWIVQDLQASSAIITLEGISDIEYEVEKIVEEYAEIGDALRQKRDLSHKPSRVKKAAQGIRQLTQTVEYVRFQTPDSDYTIYDDNRVATSHAPSESIGMIVGRVQTLSNRSGLRFILYDSLFYRAVACYLSQGQEEMMREAWGKLARVSGRISREAGTGKPIAVRRIMSVKLLAESPPGSYRKAKGAVSWKPGDKRAEDVIRELRDA